ncbi:MAG: hypothetical protein EBZ60_09495, partial [Betaproteobacteria bacterium]|nr:hypothetical protein [Betaproteobacteria bacterium]
GILVAAGEELPNAMTMLPNIGKTALASQATMQDLSATAIAFSQNLGVAAGDMDKALAMAHQAGKLGRYELKAMAQGMPAIAAGAGNIGIKGLSGVAQVTSAAQIWRQVVGNDSGTVTMAENFFAKINSPEVNSQLMKDYGINLSKIATNATARGEDAMLAVTEALLNTVGKDAEKWGEVVGDMQARTAMQALVKRKDEYIKNRDAILGKKGEEGKTAQAQRDKDAEQARNAAYAGFEQMKNSLERLVIVMGSAFAPAMGKLAWVVEKVADAVQFASNNFPGLTTVVGAGTVAIVGIAGVIVTLATVVGGATIAITLAAKAMSMLSSRARRFAEVTAFRGGTSARGGYLGGRGRGLGRGRTRGRWGAVGGFLGDMFGFGDVVDMFDMANEARQSGRARTPGAQAARRLAAR